MEIVEVFSFKVRLVVVAVFQTVPVPLNVHVPLPMVIVLVFEFDDAKDATDTPLLADANVPWVSVNALLAVSVAPKVVVPEWLIVTA